MKETVSQEMISAVKAVSEGKATPNQQMAAIAFIVVGICKVNDNPFSGTDRDTSFNCGRAEPGQIIRKITEGEAKSIYNIKESKNDGKS